MAKLYISEFAVARVPQGSYQVQAPLEPSVADQSVAIGGASAQSAAFNAKTSFVLLSADAVCSVAFGATGAGGVAATTGNFRLPANFPMLFAVVPGQCVACIANT